MFDSCSVNGNIVDVLDLCLRDCAELDWIQLFDASRCLGIAVNGWAVFSVYKREEPMTEREYLQDYFADEYYAESLPCGFSVDGYDRFIDLCWDLRHEIDSIAGLLILRMKRSGVGDLYPTVIALAKGLCEQILRAIQCDLSDESEEDALRESFIKSTLRRIIPDAFIDSRIKELAENSRLDVAEPND